MNKRDSASNRWRWLLAVIVVAAPLLMSPQSFALMQYRLAESATEPGSEAAAENSAVVLAETTKTDFKPVNKSQRTALTQLYQVSDGVSFHKDMFATPFTYNERFTGVETETVFQLSLKARVLDWPVFFGYTQRSFWQAYDHENSAPFRETNYNPELFARFLAGNWLSSEWGFDLGFEHESNGREAPSSRSWNRLYAVAFHEANDDVFSVKVWHRLKEDPKVDARDALGDDNPDIVDYYGNTEFRYRRCVDGKDCHHLFTSMLRGNLDTGKGAIELSWHYPTNSEQTSWYVYLFSGYGESLIDYNVSEKRLGIGVSLRPQ